MDVMANQKMVGEFGLQKRHRKLKIGSWQRNREKIDFLEEGTRNSLKTAFGLAEDFDARIDSAKIYKSDSYLFGISVERMEKPLVKAKEGLEEWLRANMEQQGPAQGRQGCMGGLGGGLLGG